MKRVPTRGPAACVACGREAGCERPSSPRFSPIFCAHCASMTCTLCACASSHQRGPEAHAKFLVRQRQQAAVQAAEPLAKRAWRVLADTEHSPTEQASEQAAEQATELWLEQMEDQAASGNLDLADLADVGSLPTLIKLLGVRSLRTGVCHALASIAKGGTTLPAHGSLVAVVRQLLELANSDSEGTHTAAGAAVVGATEAVVGWVERCKGKAAAPTSIGESHHWFICVACGVANGIHFSDSRPRRVAIPHKALASQPKTTQSYLRRARKAGLPAAARGVSRSAFGPPWRLTRWRRSSEEADAGAPPPPLSPSRWRAECRRGLGPTLPQVRI